jgi:hypothetical protein
VLFGLEIGQPPDCFAGHVHLEVLRRSARVANKGCNVARVENTVQIPLRRRGRGGVLVASFLILPVTVIFTLCRESAFTGTCQGASVVACR